MKAVILAGGKGSRLAPYTTVFPKPLMPLGDKPILETIIKQLKAYGFKEVILAVGYLSELIRAYFNDGSKYGLKISYSKEESPLGTAGPLSLIDGLDSTFLVMNGDILTTLPFSKLLNFHKEKGGAATIAISQRKINIDYGVIELNDNGSVKNYIEKPQLAYDVSMGIYVFDPEVLKYIPEGRKLDFPDLIKKLISEGENVYGYVNDEYWLDIGRHDDYERAQEEYNKIEGALFNVKI